jgi:hypothetical protein
VLSGETANVRQSADMSAAVNSGARHRHQRSPQHQSKSLHLTAASRNNSQEAAGTTTQGYLAIDGDAKDLSLEWGSMVTANVRQSAGMSAAVNSGARHRHQTSPQHQSKSLNLTAASRNHNQKAASATTQGYQQLPVMRRT